MLNLLATTMSAATPDEPGITTVFLMVAALVTAARRFGEMNPSGPSSPLIVMVVLSATDWPRTRPSLCRLFGTQPTPSASAAGTLPDFSGRSLMRIVPCV